MYRGWMSSKRARSLGAGFRSIRPTFSLVPDASRTPKLTAVVVVPIPPLGDVRDLRAEVFHGGMNSKARGEMLDAFRLDPEFRVLFSTDAGGLCLNLQEAASIVVNL